MAKKPISTTPSLPATLSIFPLRDTVVFPAVPAQLSSTRTNTIQLVTKALENNVPIALVTTLTPTQSPNPEDLYPTGTAATIQRLWHLPDGSVRFLVSPHCRIAITKVQQTDDGLCVKPKIIKPRTTPSNHLQALAAGVSAQFQHILSLSPHLPDELQIAALNIHDPAHLADFVAFHLNMTLAEKQALLDEHNPENRLKNLTHLMSQELEVLELGLRVKSQVQSELDRSRRDHLIREQIKALQHELGEHDTRAIEIAELRKRLDALTLPADVYAEISKEIDRLSRMVFTAPEYTTSRTYIDWILDLPWTSPSPPSIDLHHAQKTLNQHHKGLDHIKDRILDDLAVRKITDQKSGSILCLVGPPGVGKTSLGQSIAKALNRPFVRLALGGLKDEAELRGHRRTYVGAMPGRIIQSIRNVGTQSPVIMLDEIDKMSMQGSGDPAGVLLEILDPTQNTGFVDHYLNVPFDLSHVLFITTANVTHKIPDALRDRLDVIAISGYLDSEKNAIARSHILPRQKALHGLLPKQLKLSQHTLQKIIAEYTQEPGLRQLERQIGIICRRTARHIADGQDPPNTITPNDLLTYLGTPNTPPELPQNAPGIAIGLAATPFGGQHFAVETTTMPGQGHLILTGHLGDILKESAQIAVSLVRTQNTQHNIDPKELVNRDIHIHVPAGSIPKDGPSAGLAIVLSLISHLTQQPLLHKTAFTGEITLTGRVLPVGGLRDKILAAQRVALNQIVVPKANQKDIQALPENATKTLKFRYIETLAEALAIAYKGRS